MTIEAKTRNPRGVYEHPKGSGIYWIRWHDAQGVRHREKAGPKGIAVKLYRKRKQQALEGRKLPELHRRGPTFGELAQNALAYCRQHHRNQRNTPPLFARFLGWWKDFPAESLTPPEIERRLSAVEGWSEASFNRARALLSLTYNLAIRAGKVSVNPAQRVPARKERNIRKGFVDAAQYGQLAAACNSLWLRAFLALGFTYAWRAGELLGLRVAQVDLLSRTVRLEVGSTKNGHGRIIKLTAECFELVKACAAGKSPTDSLLTREDGSPVKAYRYDWEQLCARVELGRFVCRTCATPGGATVAAGRPCPLCAKAERRGVYRYEGPLVHDLRRSGVRGLVRAGIPERVAMAISGHRTRAIFDRYNIVDESDLADATRKLERLQSEGAPQQPSAKSEREADSAKLV